MLQAGQAAAETRCAELRAELGERGAELEALRAAAEQAAAATAAADQRAEAAQVAAAAAETVAAAAEERARRAEAQLADEREQAQARRAPHTILQLGPEDWCPDVLHSIFGTYEAKCKAECCYCLPPSICYAI